MGAADFPLGTTMHLSPSQIPKLSPALGIDRGLPFPPEDLPRAEVIVLVGSNPAETMPPLRQLFEKQRINSGRLIVIDPRQSETAARASLHLKVTPGTDTALANGLLHLLVRGGAIAENYIRQRTEGFEKVKAEVDKLQEMVPAAYAEMHPNLAKRYALREGQTVSFTTRRGTVIFVVKLSPGMREDTIFTPFHWGGENSANTLTHAALDPTSRMPEFKVCAVSVERSTVAHEEGQRVSS